jgi:hypothetical protein
MKPEANQQEADYSYAVVATAEGGATAQASGTMTIAKVCVASLVDGFVKAYTYDIPE